MIVRLTPVARDRIKEMLARGVMRRVIARKTGYSTATVNRVRRGLCEALTIKRATVEEILGPRQKGGHDPTPDEIAAACEAIRKVREREDLAIAEAEAAYTSAYIDSEGGRL